MENKQQAGFVKWAVIVWSLNQKENRLVLEVSQKSSGMIEEERKIRKIRDMG